MMRIVLLVLAVALLATPAQAQRGPRKNGWYDAIGKTCPAVCRANGLFPACVGHDDSGRNQYACAGNPPRLSNYRGGATTSVGCAWREPQHLGSPLQLLVRNCSPGSRHPGTDLRRSWSRSPIQAQNASVRSEDGRLAPSPGSIKREMRLRCSAARSRARRAMVTRACAGASAQARRRASAGLAAPQPRSAPRRGSSPC
jgi:hypothetical protein